MLVDFEEAAEGRGCAHIWSIDDLLEIVVQLHSPVLNLLIRLELEVGLGRHLWQIRILELKLAIKFAEVIVPFLHAPLTPTQTHMYHVKDYFVAFVVNGSLVVRQFDLHNVIMVSLLFNTYSELNDPLISSGAVIGSGRGIQ